MAHFHYLDRPSDQHFYARGAHSPAVADAPSHGKPIENPGRPSGAPSRPCGRANGGDPPSPSLRGLNDRHLLPLPARTRMPAALVAGRALRVPTGWASGPPFPRPAPAGVAAVVDSSRRVWARTLIDLSSLDASRV
ncbi:hypothetical protein GCM10027451_51360 [Geodermatophilus aquaeductus]